MEPAVRNCLEGVIQFCIWITCTGILKNNNFNNCFVVSSSACLQVNQ